MCSDGRFIEAKFEAKFKDRFTSVESNSTSCPSWMPKLEEADSDCDPTPPEDEEVAPGAAAAGEELPKPTLRRNVSWGLIDIEQFDVPTPHSPCSPISPLSSKAGSASQEVLGGHQAQDEAEVVINETVKLELQRWTEKAEQRKSRIAIGRVTLAKDNMSFATINTSSLLKRRCSDSLIPPTTLQSGSNDRSGSDGAAEPTDGPDVRRGKHRPVSAGSHRSV